MNNVRITPYGEAPQDWSRPGAIAVGGALNAQHATAIANAIAARCGADVVYDGAGSGGGGGIGGAVVSNSNVRNAASLSDVVEAWEAENAAAATVHNAGPPRRRRCRLFNCLTRANAASAAQTQPHHRRRQRDDQSSPNARHDLVVRRLIEQARHNATFVLVDAQTVRADVRTHVEQLFVFASSANVVGDLHEGYHLHRYFATASMMHIVVRDVYCLVIDFREQTLHHWSGAPRPMQARIAPTTVLYSGASPPPLLSDSADESDNDGNNHDHMFFNRNTTISLVLPSIAFPYLLSAPGAVGGGGGGVDDEDDDDDDDDDDMVGANDMYQSGVSWSSLSSSSWQSHTTLERGSDNARSGARSDGADECVICLEVYAPDSVVRRLPCGHRFHQACYDACADEEHVRRRCVVCMQPICNAVDLHATAASPSRPPPPPS